MGHGDIEKGARERVCPGDLNETSKNKFLLNV
jgi:hypothetical protein